MRTQVFDQIKEQHPSVRLAVENDEETIVRRTLHRDDEAKCWLTYSRGVMGLGVNILGLKFGGVLMELNSGHRDPLAHRPDVIGQAGRHRRRPLADPAVLVP